MGGPIVEWFVLDDILRCSGTTGFLVDIVSHGAPSDKIHTLSHQRSFLISEYQPSCDLVSEDASLSGIFLRCPVFVEGFIVIQ